MQADNDQCPYGVKCRYLKQRKCFYFHPAWHFSQNKNQKMVNPCYHGPQCLYLKQGRCKFYHPGFSLSLLSQKEPVEQTKYLDWASFIKLSQEAAAKKRQEEERQRQRRQREQEQARIRRLQQFRMIQMEYRLEMLSQKRIKKSNPQKFEWYFSKNKTLKAMDLSQEKLQQLNQCVICYVSFMGEIQEKAESQKEQSHEKTESKIDQTKQNGYIKETIDKNEHLHRELTQLYCKHTFHKQCIKEWLSTTEHCPICRKDFKQHDIYDKLWGDEKKQLKPQDHSLRLSNPFLDQQTTFSRENPFSSLDVDSSDDDEIFFDEPDYADYENGYDEDEDWDVDYDQDGY